MEPDWHPRVLTEYEIGKCAQAIEILIILDKPIVEVMGRKADRADLEADLGKCLEIWDHTGRIKFWTLPHEDSWRYGFYEHPWALRALEFLERTALDPADRHWIAGLLFGYRAHAIQQFIDKEEVLDVPSDT